MVVENENVESLKNEVMGQMLRFKSIVSQVPNTYPSTVSMRSGRVSDDFE